MTSLDQREHALETEFAHQEELKFKARERAVRALARWAAVRLGMSVEAVEVYCKEVVANDITNPTAEGTIERVAAALAPQGVRKVEIRRMMNQFLATAETAAGSTVQPSR